MGKPAFHLIKVIRIGVLEEVLLIDGQGVAYRGQVKEVSKKNIEGTIVDSYKKDPQHSISVLVGLVKKDALDSMIKMSVELGANRILLFAGEFSAKHKVNPQRLRSLCISALEQSNNYYLPSVEWYANIESVPFEDFEHTITFHLSTKENRGKKPAGKSTLLVVGPEGGLSSREVAYLEGFSSFVTLPTPILRAPTALAAAIGHLL